MGPPKEVSPRRVETHSTSAKEPSVGAGASLSFVMVSFMVQEDENAAIIHDFQRACDQLTGSLHTTSSRITGLDNF